MSLRALDERLGRDAREAHERIRATVQELWGSDELRAISPTVLDEVRGGLVHFTSTLVDVVPRVYRELDRALRDALPWCRLDRVRRCSALAPGSAATVTATRSSPRETTVADARAAA